MKPMNEILDLFGKTRFQTQTGVLSERATLIKYFSDKLGKPPKQIAIRLGHYKRLDHLYAIQSGYKDRENRQGKETADKWWWWMTRTTK